MSTKSHFNKYQALAGQISGQKFDVRRPDYGAGQADQLGTTVYTGVKYRALPGSKFGERQLSGTPVYNIIGRRGILQPGDVLYPQEVGGCAVITVDSLSDQKAISGFMTDRVGTLALDVDTVLHTNVRFSWLPIVFPGSALHDAFAGSLGISTRRCAMYKRPDIKRGMRLIEVTAEDQQRWRVTEFITQNNIMLVNVEFDVT